MLQGKIAKYSDKKIVKLSKIVADCLQTGAVNFKFFKYLQVDSLSKQTLSFTKLVLKQLFQRMTSSDLRSLAEAISKVPGN